MFEKSAPHPEVGVAISTLTAGELKLETAASWDELRNHDFAHCQHVVKGGHVMLQSGPRVAEGRSQVVQEFLTNPRLKNAHWLAMIDADMDFEPHAICQLLGSAYGGNAKADPMNPDCYLIGGLCFAGHYARMYPTIYQGAKHQATGQVVPEPVKDYPRDQLVKVMATGAAFLLVHRQVLAHMTKPWPDGYGTSPTGEANPHPWFVEGQNAGVQFGEDIAFCLRANALGYATYVDTRVKVGHVKQIVLTEQVWDDYVERQAAKQARSREALKPLGGDLLLPAPAEVR